MNLSPQLRLTDELERELLLRETIAASREVEILPALKSTGITIVRSLARVFAFIGNINDAMNQARARSALYAGSQW